MDPQERKKLEELYKKKKMQRLSLEKYTSLQKERLKKEQRKIPKPIQYVFSFFSFVLFIFGIFFLISLLYLIVVNWK
jgi:hypothetical protein